MMIDVIIIFNFDIILRSIFIISPQLAKPKGTLCLHSVSQSVSLTDQICVSLHSIDFWRNYEPWT